MPMYFLQKCVTQLRFQWWTAFELRYSKMTNPNEWLQCIPWTNPLAQVVQCFPYIIKSSLILHHQLQFNNVWCAKIEEKPCYFLHLESTSLLHKSKSTSVTNVNSENWLCITVWAFLKHLAVLQVLITFHRIIPITVPEHETVVSQKLKNLIYS